MNDWDRDQEEAPPDWTKVKRGLLAGAAFAVAVVVWVRVASPGEERLSAGGFNLGAGAVAGAPGARAFERRPATSLDMVSAQIGDGPDGVKASRDASVAPEAAPAQAVASPAVAPAPAASPSPAEEAKDLAAAGVPTDAKGLTDLGGRPGLLSSLAGKLLDHPKVLRAIMNNKTVVAAFMSRPRVQENCRDAGALKNYLSDPNSAGMKNVFPVIQSGLSDTARASTLVTALAGTEMVKAVSSCPSLSALSDDSTAIVGIAMANPKALSLATDPRAIQALAADPRASGALAGVQSKLGGMK